MNVSARPGKGTSLVLQVAAFGALGLLLLAVGAEHTKESADFSGTPRFGVWAVVIAVQVATWPIIFRVGLDSLREVHKHLTAPRVGWDVARVIALVGVIGLFWLSAQLGDERPDTGLWGHPVRMGIATLGGLIAAIPCLLTMWRTYDALEPGHARAETASDTIDRICVLRGAFTASLAAVGVLVTEATLASGALRNALIAWDPTVAERFPAEFVFLYGMFFTALLAAAAVPTYGRLRRQAAAIVNEVFPPLPPSEGSPWQSRLQERRDLAGFIDVQGGPLQSFQSAVVVAGPLLTGLLSLLIPTSG